MVIFLRDVDNTWLVINFEYSLYGSAKLNFRAASFPGFAWPKTTLTPETEHGLTSEFGMGSGGSRALWPAYPNIFAEYEFIKLSLRLKLLCQLGNLYNLI